MNNQRFIKLLDFFVGLFFGIAFFGGILCFYLLEDNDLILAIIVCIAFFGIFAFFALVAKSISILLKNIK